MKNLIIIRHAKSSWNAPLNDIDRPLEQRGMKDAHLVAMNSINFLPPKFQIFSSIAKRASETALIFAQSFSYPIESITFSPELYTFDENRLEKVIKAFNNSYDNVILFGHNEAITNFVNKFGDVFIDNVSTSGLVFLQFNTEDWQNIENGKTLKVLFPKDLK
jgi:phosphohistidine phosphatase